MIWQELIICQKWDQIHIAEYEFEALKLCLLLILWSKLGKDVAQWQSACPQDPRFNL